MFDGTPEQLCFVNDTHFQGTFKLEGSCVCSSIVFQLYQLHPTSRREGKNQQNRMYSPWGSVEDDQLFPLAQIALLGASHGCQQSLFVFSLPVQVPHHLV